MATYGDRRLPARFWSKTELADGSACWLWTAALDKDGYGTFWWIDNTRLAHRVAYGALTSALPAETPLDHLCRVRSCVNPTHLQPVTPAENTRRGLGGVLRVREPQCSSGHAYDGANTYWHGTERHCRACNAAAQRRFKARAQEAS